MRAHLTFLQWKFFQILPVSFQGELSFPVDVQERDTTQYGSQEELLHWIWWLLLQGHFVRHGSAHLLYELLFGLNQLT